MGKSNQFRILQDDDESKWQFNSQKFADALIEFRDLKNSQLPKVDGHRAREWSLSRIYKEIEAKYNITEGAMKQWKAGNNGPGTIEQVRDCAKYLGHDYHDFLEQVIPEKSDIDFIGILNSLLKEDKDSMSEEKKFINWIYEQCIELEWLRRTYIPEGADREFCRENKLAVIREKADSIHLEIEKRTLLFSAQFCNKLHRIVFEITMNESYTSEPPYRETISEEMVYDTMCDDRYWYSSDRKDFIRSDNPDDVKYIQAYIFDEIDWLEEMDIFDYKPKDDDLLDACDTLEFENVSDEERVEITNRIIGYGAGALDMGNTISPRTLAMHHYCKDLQLVFKHDFPEIAW